MYLHKLYGQSSSLGPFCCSFQNQKFYILLFMLTSKTFKFCNLFESMERNNFLRINYFLNLVLIIDQRFSYTQFQHYLFLGLIMKINVIVMVCCLMFLIFRVLLFPSRISFVKHLLWKKRKKKIKHRRATVKEGYQRVVIYGQNKTRLRTDKNNREEKIT